VSLRDRVEKCALRTAQKLIIRACAPLPEGERDERCREWVAEVYAVLEYPRRFWPLGVLAVLAYATDQFRTTWPSRKTRTAKHITRSAKARKRTVAGVVGVVAFVVAGVAGVAAFVADADAVAFVAFAAGDVVAAVVAVGPRAGAGATVERGR
jgi:hypothetical protein